MPVSDVELLRQAGLRVTQPRLAVLAAVRAGGHLDVDAVARDARGRIGRISTQTVYDVLRVLTDAGLTRRIQPPGGPARYEMRTGGSARDGHHHMVCRDCGAIADVNRVVGPQPCLDPGSQAAFQVDDVEITFWGRCPDCQSATVGGNDE